MRYHPIGSLLKKFIVFLMLAEARLILKRRAPVIIAVTGNVGKTSTKEAIFTVFSQRFRTAKNKKVYRGEADIAAIILGLEPTQVRLIEWLISPLQGVLRIIFPDPYPEVFVLEMGVDRPSDLDKFLQFIRPSISVITAIGDVPAHVEFFSGPEALAREKAKLVKVLGVDEYALLNFDDETVYAMREKTRARVLTYGFGEGADVRASNYKLFTSKVSGEFVPRGLTFKLEYQESFVPVRLYNAFGKQHVYAALAAAACGIARGLNTIEVGEALSAYEASPGRLKSLSGIKNTTLLDDTYNASPLSMHAALDILEDLSNLNEINPRPRKIAVLGDMLEIGKYTIQAHKAVGERARNVVDVLFTVGARSRFIAEEAIEKGMSEDNVFSFATAEDVGRKLQEILQKGDLVLIKGSQLMRMEKIVEEVMAEPQKAKELLTRQESYWKEDNFSVASEMATRLLGLVLIIAGIISLFLPFLPGLVFLAIGFFMVVKGSNSRK